VVLVVLVVVELAAPALLQALQGLPAPFIVFALFPCCEHAVEAAAVNAHRAPALGGEGGERERERRRERWRYNRSPTRSWRSPTHNTRPQLQLTTQPVARERCAGR
jgi:hypothetical protein